MTELSPAAQAVLDAWENKLLPDVTCLTHDPVCEALAAALRAAADQVVPVPINAQTPDGHRRTSGDRSRHLPHSVPRTGGDR